MILLIWGALGLESLASGSYASFYIPIIVSVPVRQRYRSTGYGDVVHQMGLKSNQMGGIMCVA